MRVIRALYRAATKQVVMGARVSMVPVERIQARIRVIRGHKVILDADLAELYEVQLRAMNQAVQRNLERFPADFMLRLSAEELTDLRSQNVISSVRSHGGRRHAPFAFTEQGVAMMSSVLRSPRAIQVNIEIMRSFVELRRFALTHDELKLRLLALEKNTRSGFKKVAEALRELMKPANALKPTLGFARKKLS